MSHAPIEPPLSMRALLIVADSSIGRVWANPSVAIGITVSPDSVTFATAHWSVAQTITVSSLCAIVIADHAVARSAGSAPNARTSPLGAIDGQLSTA